MSEQADIIDAEQCAKLLRCTPERIEELARAGELPALKFGRGWIFVRVDLLTFLAERARADAEERRGKRTAATSVSANLVKPRRRVPPVLPTLPR